MGPAATTKYFPGAGTHLQSGCEGLFSPMGGCQFSLSVYTVRLFFSRIPERSSKGAFL